MKQEITELTRAVNRLAAAMESLKEGEKEKSPRTPLKEKGKKNTHTPRARGMLFITSTLEMRERRMRKIVIWGVGVVADYRGGSRQLPWG